MFVSLRKCLGTDTTQTSLFTTPTAQNLALKPLNGGLFGCKNDERHFNYILQVFAHIVWNIHKRYLYDSGSILVLILHKQVRLPPQNAQNLALKPLNRGALDCKQG